MKGFTSKVLVLGVIVALLVTATAGAAASKWSGVTRVAVMSANGSQPSSKTNPRKLNFMTAAQLKKVTGALNANQVAHRSGHPDPGMCAGGVDLTITILQNAKQTKLDAFLCGHKTYGSAGGNVKGFMRAVGLKVPAAEA